jgi:outer membrane protein OmpA-like peptidoglycan-associated protein
MRSRRLWILGAALVALAPAVAQAQRGIDANIFRPALDSYGIFTIERAEVSHQWDVGFKIYGDYAGNPFRLKMYDPTNPTMPKTQVLIDRIVALHLGMHLGLTNWLELVMDFPVAATNFTSAYGNQGEFQDSPLVRTGFYEPGPYTSVAPPDGSALDARIGFKAKLFRKSIFGMALALIATLPFGDGANFLGDNGITFRPNLIADVTKGPITVAINLGAVVRQSTQVFDPHDLAAKNPDPRMLIDLGHELTYGLGLAYRFVHWVGLGVEFYGYVPLVSAACKQTPTKPCPGKDYTADVLGGLQFFPTKDLVVAAGAGAGVLTSAARHDDYRVFLGITWAPVEGKGVSAVGGVDSDNDGIPDAQDACPNEAEDKDGFEDEDGCPDPDNDQDGIPDKKDKCPNEPEDKDGYQDDDGCPETDNDGDGIPDAQDKCPNDPEDRDGFQDDDGCPDADNDGDGIPDVADKCPNEPETRNGVDDDDGCPDSGGQVVVTRDKIAVPEQIQFETGKAVILAASDKVLNGIAEKIKANPQVKRIRIEGHSDDPGGPKKNQELSQARAEAVREYLMKRGIEPERLQAVGYGNSRPLSSGKTKEAHAKNRRVEFIIVEQ